MFARPGSHLLVGIPDRPGGVWRLGEMLPSPSGDDGLGIRAEKTDGGTLYGHVGARSGFHAFA